MIGVECSASEDRFRASPVEECLRYNGSCRGLKTAIMATTNASRATHDILGPSSTSTPLVICFHGSGESCSPSWSELSKTLSQTYRVLLYDRGSARVAPEQTTKHLESYLEQQGLLHPYVLIAHSHGGTFARHYLHKHPHKVASMVLVETGQETALPPKIEDRQYTHPPLGAKPLSVIRGNSLIGKWKELETMESQPSLDTGKIAAQRKLLEAWDSADEQLKKKQLKLSRNSRYVYVPDCGHHVVRDRPDVVVAEVEWIMNNLISTQNGNHVTTWTRLKNLFFK